jgi:hypothetical protein
MPTDPLDPILEAAAVDTHLLYRPQLEAIGRTVSSIPAEEFIAAVVFAPGLSWNDDQPRPLDYFEIHSRQWRIDASHADNRQHLVISTAAAALVDALHLHLSTTWVIPILPTVLTVGSVRHDETGLHFELQRYPAPPLPPHLADNVNPDDYAEFAREIKRAAPSLHIPVGGTIEFTRHDGVGAG